MLLKVDFGRLDKKVMYFQVISFIAVDFEMTKEETKNEFEKVTDLLKQKAKQNSRIEVGVHLDNI